MKVFSLYYIVTAVPRVNQKVVFTLWRVSNVFCLLWEWENSIAFKRAEHKESESEYGESESGCGESEITGPWG